MHDYSDSFRKAQSADTKIFAMASAEMQACCDNQEYKSLPTISPQLIPQDQKTFEDRSRADEHCRYKRRIRLNAGRRGHLFMALSLFALVP